MDSRISYGARKLTPTLRLLYIYIYKWGKNKKKYSKKVGPKISRDARKLHGYPGSKKHKKEVRLKEKKLTWTPWF